MLSKPTPLPTSNIVTSLRVEPSIEPWASSWFEIVIMTLVGARPRGSAPLTRCEAETVTPDAERY